MELSRLYIFLIKPLAHFTSLLAQTWHYYAQKSGMKASFSEAWRKKMLFLTEDNVGVKKQYTVIIIIIIKTRYENNISIDSCKYYLKMF